MPVRISRGPTDESVMAVRRVLEQYEAAHPGADIELYRQSPVSIRVRVVEDRFRAIDFMDSHGYVWHFLNDRLPEEVMEEISVLLTVSPEQAKRHVGSLEFDDPYFASTGGLLPVPASAPASSPQP